MHLTYHLILAIYFNYKTAYVTVQKLDGFTNIPVIIMCLLKDLFFQTFILIFQLYVKRTLHPHALYSPYKCLIYHIVRSE